MRDDEYSEIIWSDLSLEVPTARATLHCHLVPAGEAAPRLDTAGLDRIDVEPSAESLPEPNGNTALTTLFLGVTVCLVGGVAWGFGLSAVTSLFTGFAGTVGIYLLVHFTSGRPGR